MRQFILRCGTLFAVAFLGLLNGCGGTATQYTVSLTPSGLSGTLSVALNKNSVAEDSLTFTSDTLQTFTTKLASSDTFSFTITNPTGQTCAVTSVPSSISSNTSLTVLCVSTGATVTGAVNGLASGQLIKLALNNGQTQLLGPGTFSFDNLPTGFQYAFTLLVDGPGKRCSLTNSSGTVSANINILISCKDVTILYANGSVYDGNLGGRIGADGKCLQMMLFMGSHFVCDVNKAFISTSSGDQIADFPTIYSVRSDLPVYINDTITRTGETLFKNDWSGLLTDAYLDEKFNIYVWSGSNTDGTVSSNSCNGFTSNDSGTYGSSLYLTGLNTFARPCIVQSELACACLHKYYQVGGSISGVTSGTSVVVTLTSGSTTETITLVDNGSFYSGSQLSAGASYSATLTSSPQTCSFSGASSGTISSTSATALTITCTTLSSIAVTPATATAAVSATQQYTATGTYSDSSTADITSSVTWSSSSTSVATISSAGLATGVATGSSSITATLSGVTSNTATLTVSPTLSSIAITPTSATIHVFGSPSTQQYTATGTYSDSSTADITSSVTWTSSNTAAATINASGLATAVDYLSGTASITATLSGVTSNSSTLTVSP